MLTSADAELAGRDAALPGLASLLDPDAFALALRTAAPDVDFERAVPTYLRYKPATNCLAAYRLEVADAPLLVYAKTFAKSAGEKATKAKWAALRGAGGLPASFVLPDAPVAVFSFPHDVKLEVLRRIADPAALARALPKILARRPEITTGRISTLSYKPERRFVGRLDTPDGDPVVLRFYAEREFQRASLPWRRIKSRGPLRKATRIGAWRTRRVIGVEWLRGEALGPVLATDDGPAAVARVGCALACLQAQRDRIDTKTEPGVSEAELRAAAETLGFLVPDLASRVGELARHLTARLASRRAPDALVHGDFYDDQVLVEGDEVAVLDLDRVRPGDPSLDLGTFVAHLDRAALHGRLSESQVDACATALHEGHADVSGADAGDVALHAAVALLKLAAEPFRRRVPDWTTQARALVDRAESRADYGRAPSPRTPRAEVEVDDGLGAADDPALPWVRQALDPNLVSPWLPGPPHSLRSIRTLRHKAGRRCLIAYAFDPDEPVPLELLGKIRSRGADQRTHDLCTVLRDAGFGSGAEDGIEIPEPQGLVPVLHLWLQRRVPGTPATLCIPAPGGEALAARVADVALKLQHAGVATSRRHAVEDELRILFQGFELVAAQQPRWSGRLDALRHGCERLAASIEAVAPMGIHRDLHPDQILVDGDRLYLIDLDLYASSDPAIDPANFIAHLTELALRTRGDPGAFAAHESVLAERYLAGSASPRPAALDAYTRLSLARHVYISQRIEDRRPHTEAILALCEERIL